MFSNDMEEIFLINLPNSCTLGKKEHKSSKVLTSCGWELDQK